MSKPPESTPHSDLDGVRQDEDNIIDSANKAGQGAGDLARAKKQSLGRPQYEKGEKSRDDRTG